MDIEGYWVAYARVKTYSSESATYLESQACVPCMPDIKSKVIAGWGQSLPWTVLKTMQRNGNHLYDLQNLDCFCNYDRKPREKRNIKCNDVDLKLILQNELKSRRTSSRKYQFKVPIRWQIRQKKYKRQRLIPRKAANRGPVGALQRRSVLVLDRSHRIAPKIPGAQDQS